jgi:hypothetical protein
MILLAADSMIKIITLPSDAAMPRRMAFPSPDEIHHAISRIPPKRDQGVQMVGHDQGQLHPPTAFLVVKFYRIKQLAHHLRIRQRGLTAFFAVDRDEKCRVIRNPNRRTMRPPSGLTNGHGVMSHWKNSNCIRIMSKRILALSRDFSVGRDLSPKGPHADAVSMLTLILPLGRLGRASLPKILTSTPSKNRWQGPFSERSACGCNIDADAYSSSRTLWKSVPAYDAKKPCSTWNTLILIDPKNLDAKGIFA